MYNSEHKMFLSIFDIVEYFYKNSPNQTLQVHDKEGDQSFDRLVTVNNEWPHHVSTIRLLEPLESQVVRARLIYLRNLDRGGFAYSK